MAVCIAAAATVAGAETPTSDLESATATLKAASDELHREDAAFRKLRTGTGLSAREVEDYAGFVAGLRLRLLEQCEVVRALGGEDAVRKFDCVLLDRDRAALPPAGSGAAVQTEEEKRKALDARLDAIESDIDGNLLKRQEEIRQSASNRAAGGGGGASGGGTAGGAAGGAAGGSNGSQAKPGGTAGDAGGTQASGGKQASGGPPAPAGKAAKPATERLAKREKAGDGGSDDDIVARQLREAAEKETDPVLKEKLWAEYNKYKASGK